MKLDLENVLLRFIAAASESLFLYVCAIALNNIFLFGLPLIDAYLIIIASVLGLVQAAFIQKSVKEEYRKTVLVIIALVFAAILSAVSGRFDLLPSIALFPLFLAVSAAANVKWNADINQLYTKLQFLAKTGIVLFAVIISSCKGLLELPALVYTAMGVFLLSRTKHRNNRSADTGYRNITIDIGITLLVTAPAFILSQPEISGFLLRAANTAYRGLINLIINILRPALLFIYGLLQGSNLKNVIRSGYEIINAEAGPEMNKVYLAMPDHAVNPLFARIAAAALLVALIACILYFMFRKDKREKADSNNLSFTEDREFAFAAQGISNGAAAIRKLFRAVTGWGLDNGPRARLRREYKRLLGELKARGIIGDIGYTPLKASKAVIERYPALKIDMEWISGMYEEVRYGIRQPEKVEMNEFRQKTYKIIKSL